MLVDMPESVYAMWVAFDCLKNPEYRKNAVWDTMDEDEFIEAQSTAIQEMIDRAAGAAERSGSDA